MKQMGKARILRLTQLAMLTAIAVILVAFIRIPLIPTAPFLTYDMADVPVLMAAMLFGPAQGLLVLGISSGIQSLAFSASGWIGFVMHFLASAALVLCVGMFCKKRQRTFDMVVGMVLGVLAMTAVMIPMNLWLTVEFLHTPREAVVAMLLPAIIPFNLLKGGLNCIISAILFKGVVPALKKTPFFSCKN